MCFIKKIKEYAGREAGNSLSQGIKEYPPEKVIFEYKPERGERENTWLSE